MSAARATDLRSFLRDLLDEDERQIVVVDRPVDPVFEVTAIVDKMRAEAGFDGFPAVLFTAVKGSEIPLLINLHTYDRLAASIGATTRDMVEQFSRREATLVPTAAVDPTTAPVKEVVWTGEEARLDRLPLLRHQELDGGKYITSAAAISRDPITGRLNAGIFRAQVHSATELGFMPGPYQNTGLILRENRDRKQPMQVALVIGHHPALLMASTTKPRGMGGELEVAGGLLGEPIEMVPAETVDLDVPARAEIVIEGTIDTDPSAYKEEGPFGEYPRYYTGTGPQPVIKVSAITMRRSPIYVDIFNAHAEHLALGGLARMGFLLTRLKEVCPNVTNVHLPISASARLHAYISMKKRVDGEHFQAAFTLLANNSATKAVFVVDDDIDVTNEADVLWAMATRFQADKDLTVINNALGGWLNPPTYSYIRDEKGGMESKLIFDCTRSIDNPAFSAPVVRVPEDVKSGVDPKDYVRAVSAVERNLMTAQAD